VLEPVEAAEVVDNQDKTVVADLEIFDQFDFDSQ